jgi:hypothetical protein
VVVIVDVVVSVDVIVVGDGDGDEETPPMVRPAPDVAEMARLLRLWGGVSKSA